MSRSFKLYRLQQIDSQIDWLQARLKEIEKALKEDLALRQATQKAEEAEKAHQQARKALHSAEDEVREQHIKIEQSEATLYSGKVRNPKELQDMQNEVASLKRYLEVLEDRQLDAMLSEEEAAALRRLAEEELEKERLRCSQQYDSLSTEQEKVSKDLDRLKKERQAAANSIEAGDVEIYMNLRKTRRGIAVAKITDRACSACGSTLNAILLFAALSPNQITNCDTCGRILYAGEP